MVSPRNKVSESERARGRGEGYEKLQKGRPPHLRLPFQKKVTCKGAKSIEFTFDAFLSKTQP